MFWILKFIMVPYYGEFGFHGSIPAVLNFIHVHTYSPQHVDISTIQHLIDAQFHFSYFQ